ncbi:MAG: hypothetical protein KDD25_07055 [Bdellovibrionales bacterium]|nr:hypothetical protein [Bdellovibrionales bacterium]
MKFKISEKVYCAFCGTQKNVYRHRHLTVFNFFETLVLSLVLMYILWESLDFRFLMIWVGTLIVAEVLMQLRWRLSLRCKKCGFDPVVYRRSPGLAAENVKRHLESARNSTQILESAEILKSIPYRTKDGKVVRRNDESRYFELPPP